VLSGWLWGLRLAVVFAVMAVRIKLFEGGGVWIDALVEVDGTADVAF